MPKPKPTEDPPLKVEIPRPADDKPGWSRVGVIAALGFVIGIAWPRVAGVKIGPSAPEDERPEAAAAVSAAPSASPAAAASALPSAGIQGAAAPAGEAANRQQVVVSPGTITRCFDKKNKRVDDCGQLGFDAVALPKLRELAKCPSAIGLEGKMSIGFNIDFQRKDVQVTQGKNKKTSLPSSTVQGILECAAREFSTVSLDEVQSRYKKYSLSYTATFYPPGKQPDAEGKPKGEGDDEEQEKGDAKAGDASGLATVNWDTALVRKEPKDGDVVARLVRGTRVKIVGRQNDWYKVEHGSSSGWVHRAAIGL
jgi:hypothetical protein